MKWSIGLLLGIELQNNKNMEKMENSLGVMMVITGGFNDVLLP